MVFDTWYSLYNKWPDGQILQRFIAISCKKGFYNEISISPLFAPPYIPSKLISPPVLPLTIDYLSGFIRPLIISPPPQVLYVSTKGFPVYIGLN